MKIGIVGAGWNGCHIALELSRAGHQVMVFERHASIFCGVSGDFGIRLHKGPHYPRSAATRAQCLGAFERFCSAYPELVVAHEQSVYAHGVQDASGQPSKVSGEVFSAVCHESPECRQLDTIAAGYQSLQSAFALREPSVALGERLRRYFCARLSAAGVEVRCRSSVDRVITRHTDYELMLEQGECVTVDKVINCTGYEALLPDAASSALGLEVVYQVCLGLRYRDLQPGQRPISFIVMDGWFPCLMPVVTDHRACFHDYLLTHGSYTILGSHPTARAARTMLDGLDATFVERHIKPLAEYEMTRFWPAFAKRFAYAGWKGAVQAKLRTRSEFRGAMVFEHAGVVYVFPGKISNVFQAADEVQALLAGASSTVANGVAYVTGGVTAQAWPEIMDCPQAHERNTANLQTYVKLNRSSPQARAET